MKWILLKAFINGMRNSAMIGSEYEVTCSHILRKMDKLENEFK